VQGGVDFKAWSNQKGGSSQPDVQAVEVSTFVAISPTRDDNTNWEPCCYEALISAVSARWGLSAKFSSLEAPMHSVLQIAAQ
jgi:hypothetical protein